MTDTPKEKKKSITEYAVGQRLQSCSVCRLPEEARDQLIIGRRQKRLERDTILAYLEEVWGWERDEDTFTTHMNGNHDKKLRELTK